GFERGDDRANRSSLVRPPCDRQVHPTKADGTDLGTIGSQPSRLHGGRAWHVASHVESVRFFHPLAPPGPAITRQKATRHFTHAPTHYSRSACAARSEQLTLWRESMSIVHRFGSIALVSIGMITAGCGAKNNESLDSESQQLGQDGIEEQTNASQ